MCKKRVWGFSIRLIAALVVVFAAHVGQVEADNTPVVRIDSPSHDSTHAVGTVINFSGVVRDAKGAAVNNAVMVWSSQVDGEIGTGQAITSSALSVGNHRITCMASDASGKTLGSTTIRIKVDYAKAGGDVDLTGVGGAEVEKGAEYFISPF